MVTVLSDLLVKRSRPSWLDRIELNQLRAYLNGKLFENIFAYFSFILQRKLRELFRLVVKIRLKIR